MVVVVVVVVVDMMILSLSSSSPSVGAYVGNSDDGASVTFVVGIILISLMGDVSIAYPGFSDLSPLEVEVPRLLTLTETIMVTSTTRAISDIGFLSSLMYFLTRPNRDELLRSTFLSSSSSSSSSSASNGFTGAKLESSMCPSMSTLHDDDGLTEAKSP